MLQLNTTTVVIIVLFVIVIIYALTRCKMSCGGGIKEGMSHRLTTNHVLEGNAYQKTQLPEYTLPGGRSMKLTPPNTTEKYTDVYQCRKKCENVPGATPNANCVQECMNTGVGVTAMNLMTTKCASDGDCDGNSTCVSPSYYGGGDNGFCMDSNEPGIPRMVLPSLRKAAMQRGGGPSMNESRMNGSLLPGQVGMIMQKAQRQQSGRPVGRPPLQGSCGQPYGTKENFALPQTCLPGQYFNEAAGACQPRFQGVSSALAVHMARPGNAPDISLPGSTFLEYGVGYMDPVDVPIQIRGMGSMKLLTDM